MKQIRQFLIEVQRCHGSGLASEHSYRPAIKQLIEGLSSKIQVINEPKRFEFGAPDFSINEGDIDVGHIEAKNLSVNIDALKGDNADQQARYRKALPNLIYTNCLDWHFYWKGQRVDSVSIGQLEGKVKHKPEQFEKLEACLRAFIKRGPITITSPEDLARTMASQSYLAKYILERALTQDKIRKKSTPLWEQYRGLKENLIMDISVERFAEIYAETIAYGMFAARLHDDKPESFCRIRAAELLPRSNPFLRRLFSYIAGPNFDSRLVWIIDILAEVMRNCDIAQIVAGLNNKKERRDPFLYFYETFLEAYNPKERRKKGVWYTPESVVSFIVRSVDEILVSEFGLVDGLADKSKVVVSSEKALTENESDLVVREKEVHRVQILDPAAGTGTFLAEVIKQIVPKIKRVAPDMWGKYISENLIPRLHGFEILMAPYTMCHLKLEMLLKDLGYDVGEEMGRMSIFLTNSLENAPLAGQKALFEKWLNEEIEGANAIKQETPIMCIIGNPPYLGAAKPAQGLLAELMKDYKKEPGGDRELEEKNPKWLNDLYVQFIRMSSHLIGRNGEGIMGFITNHSWLENPTYRGMRWHMMQTFDKIYILDLHGNANRRERSPNGEADKNVFNIRMGVAIVVAVKKSDSKGGGATIYRGDLWGLRKDKYDGLSKTTINSPAINKIEVRGPDFPFAKRNHRLRSHYDKGFCISDFMRESGPGIVTSRDGLVIDFTISELENKVYEFVDPSNDDNALRKRFFSNRKSASHPPGDSARWKLQEARRILRLSNWTDFIRTVDYRPFDRRALLYHPDMIERTRSKIMQNFNGGGNVGLCISKYQRTAGDFSHALVHSQMVESAFVSNKTGEIGHTFPLYLDSGSGGLAETREANFNEDLYKKMQNIAKQAKGSKPNEKQVFDYIYGVLHCPKYRQLYADFFRSGFPRIPWPSTADEFWYISAKGRMLRKLHLMEGVQVHGREFPFIGKGEEAVAESSFVSGRVYINKKDFFDCVPQVCWDFRVAGERVAQKWLKSRRGRILSYDDVDNYRHILKILMSTQKIMSEITMNLEL